MLAKEQREAIGWAVSTIDEQQRNAQIYVDYYSGRHRLMIDEERLEKVFKGLFKDFRLNLCLAVAGALADRLHVQSFSADDDSAAEIAMEIWKHNRMRRRAGRIHFNAVAYGDAYVLVWPNRIGYPIVYPQPANEVCVEYDAENPGRIIRAAKFWRDKNKRYNLNLYYPDRIEKYITEQRSHIESANPFRERIIEGESWPLLNPYNEVPMFHFANNADIGEVGRSELVEAISVQDALNKSVFDMLINGEFAAYPQRYALNIDVKHDHEGNPINPFKAGPERVWALTGGEGTELGQFGAADIEKMLKVKQGWALDMAQVTQTPSHYFMLPSGLISGESQKTAEQKLDSKILDRQMSFGDTWAAIMSLAVRMQRGSIMDGVELDTNWKDTKPRNMLDEWRIAELKLSVGVSPDQILREQGYTQEQIDNFREENRIEGLGQIPTPPLTL